MFKRILTISLLFTLHGCGSSDTNKQVSKPSTSTSSNVSLDSPAMIFPSVKSNLGAVDSINVKLDFSRLNYKNDIVGVSVNNTHLSVNSLSTIWSSNIRVPVYSGVNELVVDIALANGDSSEFKFEVANDSNGFAGSNFDNTVTSLSFDSFSSELFFSDAYSSEIGKFNLDTGTSSILFQSGVKTVLGKQVFWPLSIDSMNNEIYVLADNYMGTGENQEFSISTLVLDMNGELLSSYDDSLGEREIESVLGLVLDSTGTLALSNGEKAAYFLDTQRTSDNIEQWFYSGEYEGEHQSVILSGVEDQTSISAGFSPRSIIRFGKDLLIAREYSSPSATGSAAIIKAEVGPRRATLSNFAILSEGSLRVQSPTAMALNHDQTTLYIADQDKIWAMDLTQESKPFELLTSSSIIPGKKGQGPRLGSSITSMELHPEHDVLYIAAGAQGIMAVDLETGDRITVAK